MGFKATIRDDHIIITEGEEILSQEPVPPFEELMEDMIAQAPPGWDYVESVLPPCDQLLSINLTE